MDKRWGLIWLEYLHSYAKDAKVPRRTQKKSKKTSFLFVFFASFAQFLRPSRPAVSHRFHRPLRHHFGPMAGLPEHQFQPPVVVLDQRAAAFDPVAVVAVQRAIDDAHLGAVDVAADHTVKAALADRATYVAVLKLTIGDHVASYTEDSSGEFNDFLESIASKLPIDLPGNVQLIPDLRLIVDRDMYLVKPTALRHWLRSTALADAEQIAAEFVAAAARRGQEGVVHAGG